MKSRDREIAPTEDWGLETLPQKIVETSLKLNRLFQIMRLLGSSLKKGTDKALFRELTQQGYDFSKISENETTAEIVKIG